MRLNEGTDLREEAVVASAGVVLISTLSINFTAILPFYLFPHKTHSHVHAP